MTAEAAWQRAASDFNDARAARAGALDALAMAVQQLKAADLGADGAGRHGDVLAGGIVLVSLHHSVGKAWNRVQEAHREMLVAAARMDELATDAGKPLTVRR
jgi:hypothetical protein